MSHTSNTIKAPVVMPNDIAAVLQVPGTNLQELCQAPSINMWAKYKPVPYNQKEILSDYRRRQLNYGIINIPTWSNINKMANFWLGINTSSTNAPDCGVQSIYWGYQRPSSYFRLSDFSDENKLYGYFHGAEAPIGFSKFSEYTIDSSGHLRIIYNVGSNLGDNYNIGLADLVYPRSLSKSVGDMYFGVILRKQGQNDCYAVTSMKASEMPSTGAYVDISGLTATFNGTYEIFPFLSADQISFTNALGQLTDGDFIALQKPEVVGIGVTIIRMNIIDQSLSAYRDIASSTRNLYTKVTLLNDEYEGSLGATVTFEIFNSQGSPVISSVDRTVSNIGAGASYTLSTAIDMGSLVNLNAAASVRISVYPNKGVNRATTWASCTVTTGPSPY